MAATMQALLRDPDMVFWAGLLTVVLGVLTLLVSRMTGGPIKTPATAFTDDELRAAGKKKGGKKGKGGGGAAKESEKEKKQVVQQPRAASPAKKKGKKKGAAAAAAVAAVAEEAAPAPAPAAPEAPKQAAPAKGGKKKKGKGGAGAGSGGATANGGSSAAATKAADLAAIEAAEAAAAADIAAARAAAAAASNEAASEWETVKSKKRSKPMVAPANQDKVEAEVDSSSGNATLTLEIGDFAPSILGPKGSRIQAIQQDSGASLNLDKAAKTCVITGTAEQVNAAKELVIDIIGSQKKATVDVGAKRGLIFGPGGETVRRIQNETGARIELGDRGSKTATLSGKDSAVEAARQMILDILNNTNIGTVSLDSKDRPAVIGRGGANIRLLQEQSGAVIDIEEDLCTITGEAAQVKKAQELIKLFIEHRGPPPESSETLKVSRDHGHLIVGKGGATVNGLQTRTETKINISGLSSDQATIVVSGDRKNVEKCVAEIHQLIKDSSHNEVVPLSGNLVKAIIGPSGQTINNIRDTSAARVEIASDNLSVSLTGTKAQVAKAKAMVQKAIDTELGPPEVPSGQVQHAFDMGKATGRLIGANGANMTRLMKENGVRIDIKNDSMVYVTGPKAGVDTVKKEMEEVHARFEEMQERARKQKEEQARMAAAQNGDDANEDDSIDVDISASDYSGWDAPAMDQSWGVGVSSANGTTTSANGDAWGAAPSNSGANAW